MQMKKLTKTLNNVHKRIQKYTNTNTHAYYRALPHLKRPIKKNKKQKQQKTNTTYSHINAAHTNKHIRFIYTHTHIHTHIYTHTHKYKSNQVLFSLVTDETVQQIKPWKLIFLNK